MVMAVLLRLVEPFGLPALARHGESGARARLAFRTSREDALRSVATSCRKWRSNNSTVDNSSPGDLLSLRVGASRLPASDFSGS
jgi:hypothetical protein